MAAMAASIWARVKVIFDYVVARASVLQGEGVKVYIVGTDHRFQVVDRGAPKGGRGDSASPRDVAAAPVTPAWCRTSGIRRTIGLLATIAGAVLLLDGR